MNREEIKRKWFSLDHSNVPVRKQIIVDARYLDSKWWPNHGNVEVVRDGPDGYCSFSTHQENPLEYAKNCKEYKSGEYELVIKVKK